MNCCTGVFVLLYFPVWISFSIWLQWWVHLHASPGSAASSTISFSPIWLVGLKIFKCLFFFSCPSVSIYFILIRLKNNWISLNFITWQTYTILNTYRMAAVLRCQRSLTGSNPHWSNRVHIKYPRLYDLGHENYS